MPKAELLNQPLELLRLSERPLVPLRRAGVTTIGQLVAMSRSDLLQLVNFGRLSLMAVCDKLARWHLTLRGDSDFVSTRPRSGGVSPVTTLVVRDQGELIAISFDDLLKYHGRSSIAGVAHAFKAMERAFPLLSPGEPPDRYDITVETGFPGGGARDAFEMVTRAVTGERFRPAPATAGAEAPAAPGGRFFFSLGYRGVIVDLTARAGLIPEDFVEVACREAPTPTEAARARQVKEEMADRLLGLPAEEVYDAELGRSAP